MVGYPKSSSRPWMTIWCVDPPVEPLVLTGFPALCLKTDVPYPTAYGPPSHVCLECPWIVGRLTHGLSPMFRMTIPLLWLLECYIIIPLTMTHSTGPPDPSGPGFRAALDSRPDKAAEFWRCPVGETRMRRCDHQKKWKMSYFMRDVTLW